MTFIPKAAAILATFNPIFPKPSIPSVFPLSSSLLKELLEAHCPFLTADKASNRFRCMVNIREMVCSATVEAFEPGALITFIPRFDASATSTLSRPTPQRAATFIFGQASYKALFT